MKFPPGPAVATLLLLALSDTTQQAVAGPTAKPAPATLSFSVTARVSAKEAAGAASAPEQTINAKVYASGNRVRLESKLGGTPIVFLYAPPYAYKLLPTSKTGIRYSGSALPVAGPGVNLPMLRNPAGMRALLQKRGARHLATARLGGALVDLYAANSFLFLGETYKAKAWLRRSDALPVRLELTSPKASVMVSWRDYQRGHVLPGRLFAVPPGYSIRAKTQPSG
ncbi:MAG TPA: hypothetical protein VNA16_04735 [Abditibacteriaceae bacterium]|nr:hypothetical protein [Abditibacteriaceae bacterium]